MSPTASPRARVRPAHGRSSIFSRSGSPALRLVHDEESRARNGCSEGSVSRSEVSVPQEAHTEQRDAPLILIVAAGARKRALVHRELASALAPDTRFAQAANVWEVLEQAQHSGVVMLAGDLPDVSVHTLMELLGRRQPWLPVVVLDAPEAQTRSGRTPAQAEI